MHAQRTATRTLGVLHSPNTGRLCLNSGKIKKTKSVNITDHQVNNRLEHHNPLRSDLRVHHYRYFDL
jgi:hypothetical protein